MHKLIYRFVATRKKKKKEIDPFLDTVCPFRASRVIKSLWLLKGGGGGGGVNLLEHLNKM